MLSSALMLACKEKIDEARARAGAGAKGSHRLRLEGGESAQL